MFRRMDDDGSKALSMDEFVKGIRDTGYEATDEDAKKMFEAFDKDGGGTINIDEFLETIRVEPFINAAAFSIMLEFLSASDEQSPKGQD